MKSTLGGFNEVAFTYQSNSFKKTNKFAKTFYFNTGGTTEFLTGKIENNRMQFISRPFKNGKQTSIRRLSFYKLENGFVRQHGELSNDEGKTFTTEYDLEYRPMTSKKE